MEFRISIQFGKDESIVDKVNAETQEEVLESIPENGIYTFTDSRGTLHRVNLDKVNSITVNKLGKPKVTGVSSHNSW